MSPHRTSPRGILALAAVAAAPLVLASCSTTPSTTTAPPVGLVSVTALPFDSLNIGLTQDRTFTITNAGGGALTGRVSSTSADFAVRGARDYALGAGQSATFRVTFAPLEPGPDSAVIHTGVAGGPAVVCRGRGRDWALEPVITYYLTLRPDGTYGANYPVRVGLDFLGVAELDEGDGPSFVFLPTNPQPQPWVHFSTCWRLSAAGLCMVMSPFRVILAGVSAQTHGTTSLELLSGSCSVPLRLPTSGADLDTAAGVCPDAASVVFLNAGLSYKDANPDQGWLGIRQITFLFHLDNSGLDHPAPARPAARRGRFDLRRLAGRL